MKIGKETIKGLVQRNIASGLAYYWYPDPRERAAKWNSLPLGQDLARAVDAAKRRNAEIEQWKRGGSSPIAIKAYTIPQTFGAILDKYEAEKLVGLSANTQRVDQTHLNYLREWAGRHPLAWITRARVRALKLAICPDADRVPKLLRDGVRGIPGHNPAFKWLSKGREVVSWWNDHPENTRPQPNPFERFDLPKPPPRDQIWEADAIAAFGASARALGWPSIDFALRLACNFGQREADILKLSPANWQEITLQKLRMDREMFDALKSDHGPDAGKVMGFSVITGKTRRWVGVPIAGPMRDEVEAAIAAARARVVSAAAGGKVLPIGNTRLIARDPTGKLWRGADLAGQPWTQREFVDKVLEIRNHAAGLARAEGNEPLAIRLEALEFRDTRRTCVVTLMELGMDDAAISAITAHSLATIKTILEIYGPRTEAMAGRGIVAMLGADNRRREDAEKEKSA